MTYDSREALDIFARAHERHDRRKHYQERAGAATDLLKAVLTAAKAAGYDAGPEGGYIAVFQPHRGGVYLRVEDDALLVHTDREPNPDKWKKLPIEYDPVLGIFVGTAEDSYLLPAPGQPRRRRSAVAVVAEVITAMIDEQVAKGSAPRG